MSEVDYTELYRRLAAEILKRDGKIDSDTQAFIQQFITKLKAEGWQLSGDAETTLNAHLSGINTMINEAIVSAVALTAPVLQSDAVLKMAEQAFVERWPDGLTLSDRLWRWKNETRQGIQQQLQAAIRQGKAVNAVLYDMQRAIERSHGETRFKLVENHVDDWVTELHRSAQLLIHDPEARAEWNKVVGAAEERISLLKAGGSRSAAERVLDQVKKAVEKGSEALLDKAVRWWVYDKQLYHLKRIARTEMATAAHRAVIASVEKDESVIGFLWRLSASHKVTDICDYYANIEMGLGKGVWTKEAVPHHKAHPQCMCLLVPRATPIKQKGSKNYAEFIKNSPPDRRDQLLPKWVKQAVDDGVALEKLVKPDGLGLVSKKDALPTWFSHWAQRVIAPDYKPSHVYRQIGLLPEFVLSDVEVAKLSPVNAMIHISDYQLRHAIRPVKQSRGAALPLSAVEQLPGNLDKARWFYDSRHDNLIAAFDGGYGTAKAVVSINFIKKNIRRNTIVTMGMIDARHLGERYLREIKPSRAAGASTPAPPGA